MYVYIYVCGSNLLRFTAYFFVFSCKDLFVINNFISCKQLKFCFEPDNPRPSVLLLKIYENAYFYIILVLHTSA